MSIIVNQATKVICQGITGNAGAFHTAKCLEYGTKFVGGTSPGKGGTKSEHGLPVFDTVVEAARETGATATMVFVPPPFAADAAMEAADAGMQLVVSILDVPFRQVMVWAGASARPNTPELVRYLVFTGNVKTLKTWSYRPDPAKEPDLALLLDALAADAGVTEARKLKKALSGIDVEKAGYGEMADLLARIEALQNGETGSVELEELANVERGDNDSSGDSPV